MSGGNLWLLVNATGASTTGSKALSRSIFEHKTSSGEHGHDKGPKSPFWLLAD